jgi:hypothetical protein
VLRATLQILVITMNAPLVLKTVSLAQRELVLAHNAHPSTAFKTDRQHVRNVTVLRIELRKTLASIAHRTAQRVLMRKISA